MTQAAQWIFLDIDGVLRTLWPSRARQDDPAGFGYNPECVEALNGLLRVSGASLCLSSTWRDWGMRRMAEVLRAWGVVEGRLQSCTPRMRWQWSRPGEWERYSQHQRGDDIQQWLATRRQRGPVGRYVILDDEDDMGALMPFLIQTDHEKGLTWSDAHRACMLLECRVPRTGGL